MDSIDNSRKYKIVVSGFDLKIILESLNDERVKRLSKTPWENRNPNGYPPDYHYDCNAKLVRQVDSVINYIKKQIIMKELSIEEKAKHYDEAYKKVAVRFGSNVADEILFKESEDEKVKKAIFGMVYDSDNELWSSYDVSKSDVLAWLEKRGEQKPILDVEIPFGAKNSELQEATYYIPEGFHAEIEGNNVIIKKGERKPVWGEEDETVLNNLIYALANDRIGNDRDEYISYLKSLKERYTWKPSEEQMLALNLALAGRTEDVATLRALYNDLKTL